MKIDVIFNVLVAIIVCDNTLSERAARTHVYIKGSNASEGARTSRPTHTHTCIYGCFPDHDFRGPIFYCYYGRPGALHVMKLLVATSTLFYIYIFLV